MAVDSCIISLQKWINDGTNDGITAGQDRCLQGEMVSHHEEIMTEMRAWQKRDEG
jgi:hypothetical protein